MYLWCGCWFCSERLLVFVTVSTRRITWLCRNMVQRRRIPQVAVAVPMTNGNCCLRPWKCWLPKGAFKHLSSLLDNSRGRDLSVTPFPLWLAVGCCVFMLPLPYVALEKQPHATPMAVLIDWVPYHYAAVSLESVLLATNMGLSTTKKVSARAWLAQQQTKTVG